MSKKTKYQQQILFDDQDIIDNQKNNLPSESQVVFDNDDWSPSNEDMDMSDVNIEDSSRPKWLWRILLLTLASVIGIELVEFFTVGFVESPIITGLYAVVLSCITLISGSVLFKELVGLRQLKKREELRRNVTNVSDAKEDVDVISLCQTMTENLPCDMLIESEQQWADAASGEYSDEELLTLYSRIVLSRVDQKALTEVAKYSSESVVLVALSPVAVLDMMIMLWRNLRLIDKIAGLYGLKLGYWSRIKLMKQVVVNIIYAGASEVLADVSADMLGADLLGKLSGRLAQGLGAGMLTARLGIKTIHLCRPMPFDENAPRISQVRKEVLNQIKKLM